MPSLSYITLKFILSLCL